VASGTRLRLIFGASINAAYRLTSAYAVPDALQLDASSVPGGVRLRAAPGKYHFDVQRSATKVGNLTAINVIFEDGYSTR
jgi:hypothetical protein